MSEQPMEFLQADKDHLSTWKGVCRLLFVGCVGTVALLLIMAATLL